MLRFGYGTADFPKLRNQNLWYQDRTAFIRVLEDTVYYPVFLRPRRFGKSLWLSTLASYYDLAQAKAFERLFGDLDIGRNPTPLHNQYFVLRWDFSNVVAYGHLTQIKQSLFNHINIRIGGFRSHYRQWLQDEIKIDENDALASFQSLVEAVQNINGKLYLLIDEYDNFANELAFSDTSEAIDRFNALTQTDGLLKSLFKIIKGMVGTGTLDRVFITGVSPMLLADITSGFNIAQDITHRVEYHDLCGFSESEIATILRQVTDQCGLSAAQYDDALDTMRRFYNGYMFNEDANTRLYNPTLALYFLDHVRRTCKYPSEMLDVNLSLDQAKLEYMARRAGGEQFLFDLAPHGGAVGVPNIIHSFHLRDMMDMRADDITYRSLLYYLGILTLNGYLPEQGLRLEIPNLVTRGLYFQQIRRFTLPDAQHIQKVTEGARRWRWRGEPQFLCEFVEQYFFKTFSNRDYLQFSEQTVKIIFMAYLYDDLNYLLRSELEVGRGYADVVMTVRPESRPRGMLDLLIEFKYVSLTDAKIDGATAHSLSREQIMALPAVLTALDQAYAQINRYAPHLRAIIGPDQRLRSFIVLALGFDRILPVTVDD